MAVRFLALLLLLLQANPGQSKQDISTPVAHSGSRLQKGKGMETETWPSTKIPEYTRRTNIKKKISLNKSLKDNLSARKTANLGFWQRKRKERLYGLKCLRLHNQKNSKKRKGFYSSKMRKRKNRSNDESFRKVSIGQGWPRRGVIGFIQRHSDADSADYRT